MARRPYDQLGRNEKQKFRARITLLREAVARGDAARVDRMRRELANMLDLREIDPTTVPGRESLFPDMDGGAQKPAPEAPRNAPKRIVRASALKPKLDVEPGAPRIGRSVRIFHVTSNDAAASILRDRTFRAAAENQFQGFESEVKGVYGWTSMDRARMQIAQLGDMGLDVSDFTTLEIELPLDEYEARFRPDEDWSLDRSEWRASYRELGSLAVEGDVPVDRVRAVYTDNDDVARAIDEVAEDAPTRTQRPDDPRKRPTDPPPQTDRRFRPLTERTVGRAIRTGRLSEGARAGVTEYLSPSATSRTGGFEAMQRYLRTGGLRSGGRTRDEAALRAAIDQMDEAVDAGRLTTDVKLYRGLGDARTVFGSRLENLREGFEFEEDGYTSTTTNRRRATGVYARGDRPLLVEIEAPAGGAAFDVSRLGDPKDREVVLPRGTRYRVVKTAEGRVTLRVLPQAAKDAARVTATVGSYNQELFDALVRHQVGLLRLSSKMRKDAYALLDATRSDLRELVAAKLRGSKGLTSPASVRRMRALLDALEKTRLGAWGKITASWVEEMHELARAEPLLVDGIIKTTVPVVLGTQLPAASTLAAIVDARPFQGRTLRDWAKKIAAADVDRLQAQVRTGLVLGESNKSIARRLVGTVRGAGGAVEIAKRDADALARTAVNHVSNQARQAYYARNDDLVDEELYVATLDARTTPVCRAEDGERYPLSEGPIPPLHYQCRSTRVPLLDGDVLGSRPHKPTTERGLLREFSAAEGFAPPTTRAGLPRGTKGRFDAWARKKIRERTGAVPAKTSYQNWLGRQSADFQDDVLGRTKGRLFRNGGLKLKKFVNRNGDELSLRELAGRHRRAFEAAGLDPADYL